MPDLPERPLIERYFDAMRAGPDGVDTLVGMFREDAVYTEPFAGESRTHRGRRAIERMLRASQADRPPDLVLTVHTIDVDADGVFASWTCESPVFPAPVRGEDRFVIREGAIQELTVRFVE